MFVVLDKRCMVEWKWDTKLHLQDYDIKIDPRKECYRWHSVSVLYQSTWGMVCRMTFPNMQGFLRQTSYCERKRPFWWRVIAMLKQKFRGPRSFMLNFELSRDMIDCLIVAKEVVRIISSKYNKIYAIWVDFFEKKKWMKHNQ